MSNSLDPLPLRQRKPLRIRTDIPLLLRCSSDSSSSSSSSNNQNTTPRTTPSSYIPHCFFHVLSMHDFDSSDPDHLPFSKDEVLTIIKQECSGWWAAMRPQGDRVGWIPSSFVMPLDRSKLLETPAVRPYECLNDSPLSAVHDPWVLASDSEDYAALSFRLVTPTDLVPYKGFDDRVWNHDYEVFFSLPNDERSTDMEGVYVPPTLTTPPPYNLQRSHPRKPLPLEPGASQPNQPASLPQFKTTLNPHPRLCKMNDQTPLPINFNEIPELMSTFDIQDPPAVVTSQDVTGQSQLLRSSKDFWPATFHQGISEIKLLDLIQTT